MFHKLILKCFEILRSFWQFLKILCVFYIIIILLYWIQDLTQSDWAWISFFKPSLDSLLNFANNIYTFSFEFSGSIIELKYVIAILIIILAGFSTSVLTLLTNIFEEIYKNTRYVCKKTQENALNRELRNNIEKEEMSINNYVVTIHTKVRANFDHKEISVDLDKQNELMIDFIESKIGIKPMIFEGGFMYMFDNYNKIDDILEVLFKVLHASTPISYAICIQAGDNLPQLKKLISLANFGKITMAADTSYRYRFNVTHRYQTSQIGVFQNDGKTIEVHEFRELS